MNRFLPFFMAFVCSCSSFQAEPGENSLDQDQGANATIPTPTATPVVSPTPVAEVTFNQVYNQVLLSSCAQTCHNDNSGMNGGMVYVDINSQIVAYTNMVGVDSGIYAGEKRVIAGDPNGSLLVKKLEGDPNVGAQMPQGGTPLTPAQIKMVRDWILAGAKNN